MKKLLMGVSAVALVTAMGTGVGHANPTVKNVSHVDNNNEFANAAGQFNVAANTGIANINQQGNSVAAHVPVGISITE